MFAGGWNNGNVPFLRIPLLHGVLTFPAGVNWSGHKWGAGEHDRDQDQCDHRVTW